jgi:hypothetical protein
MRAQDTPAASKGAWPRDSTCGSQLLWGSERAAESTCATANQGTSGRPSASERRNASPSASAKCAAGDRPRSRAVTAPRKRQKYGSGQHTQTEFAFHSLVLRLASHGNEYRP